VIRKILSEPSIRRIWRGLQLRIPIAEVGVNSGQRTIGEQFASEHRVTRAIKTELNARRTNKIVNLVTHAYFALAHLTAPTRTAASCFGCSMCP